MDESVEQIQARHRKEQRDLVARVTNKKKNATKKTRKGINDECAELERQLKESQAQELLAAQGQAHGDGHDGEQEQEHEQENESEAKVNGVAEKLNGTSIDDQTTGTAAATTQPEDTPAASGSGAGKKRNRQKERLARRAAEQEAASLKAEQEADGMTDRRGIERKYMDGVFKANSLVEKDIQPDGHCLFSAVADQLSQEGVPLAEDGTDGGLPGYMVVRRAAAGWMEDRGDDFAPFLEEPLDGYVKKIRDTAEWGGQLELAALAARYGVGIRVVQDGRTEEIEPPEGRPEGGGHTIWLAYYRHGYGLGEHYNSLRKQAA